MVEAATLLTPTAARLTVTPRRNPRERRIAIAIGGFAVVSATTSMAMAAQTALPGDTLYPLKRALENASTTIQIDEDDKGASLLDHAAGRLDEVDELTRQSDERRRRGRRRHPARLRRPGVLGLRPDDRGVHRPGRPVRHRGAPHLHGAEHGGSTSSRPLVPDTARAALIEAAQVINLIDTAAIRLCPTCGEGAAQLPDLRGGGRRVDVLGDLGRPWPHP